MGDRPPLPGYDEIALATPPAPALRTNREHRRLYVLAEVAVTFGELGVAWHKDALWFRNWGQSFPLCRECFDGVMGVARRRRPGLTVIDNRGPATGNPPSANQEAAGQ